MNIPSVTYKTVCIHIAAETEFPKIFGKQVKDCGGKFSDIRGHISQRFVTIPSAETELLDAIVARFPGKKIPLVIDGFTIEGCGIVRDGATARNRINGSVFYWTDRAGAAPSEFLRNALDAHLAKMPWDRIIADWTEEDRRESSRRRGFELDRQIAAIRGRIAFQAARIAEGANDWETIRELGAEYVELCAEAGIDLSAEPAPAP
jgi:hypothetical protein